MGERRLGDECSEMGQGCGGEMGDAAGWEWSVEVEVLREVGWNMDMEV